MADNPLAAWLRGPERWAQAGAPDPAGAGWADGQQTQASPDQAAPVAVGALLTATTPGRAADFDEAPRR
ncbi:MAG: hypothetical protein M3N52_02595, partial [Actinomycetota bacterium]|nr:hypothetical protein [Actinomycetota bacterium]